VRKTAAYAGDPGTVGILNVGAGDIRLSFDKSNPAERIRAARIVKDMLRRGFALLIEVDVDGEKKFTRAIDFDENVCEYVIADFDGATAELHDQEEAHGQEEQSPPSVETTGGTSAPRTKRANTKKRVAAEGARAVAVGRTAGG